MDPHAHHPEQQQYPPQPHGSGGIDFDLGLAIHILRKSVWWILFVLILFIGGAFTFVHYSQPVYEASSVIQIVKKNQANTLLNVQDFYESEDISKDIELMRSEEFFKRVIDQLDLDVSYYVEGEVLNNERFRNSAYHVHYSDLDPLLFDQPIHIEFEDATRGYISLPTQPETVIGFTVGDTITDSLITFSIQDRYLPTFISSKEYEENKHYFTVNTTFTNVRKLYPNYRIDLLNASAKTVRITVRSNNPVKAATIADKIAEEYMAFDKEKQSEGAQNILKFINNQLAEVYTRLKDSETLIRDFKKENRLTHDEDIARTYIERLNELERTLAELQLQVDLLKELKKNIDQENTGVDINQLMPVLAGSEFERKVEEQIISLQELVMKRNTQLTSATRENPTIVVYDQQIEAQKTLILRSLDALEEKFTRSVSAVNAKIKEIELNFVSLPSKEIEYARLERVFNSNEKYYTLLLEKKTEYAISEAGFVSDNRILARAKAPIDSVEPRRLIIYFSSVSGALLVIMIMVAGRYLLNNELNGVQDLARLINPQISLLGVVPKYSKNIPLSQLIVDKNPKSIMAEAFRSLRTNLDFFESKGEKKVIAVTSTISGEGKTFVAINLGGILAYSDKKVVILDLDMRKPRIHKGFNSTND